MKFPLLLQTHRDDPQAVRQELLAGLCAPRAHTSPKFLYDTLGCRLFEAITELPEYDLTRTEAALLAQQLPAMHAVPVGATWVDLGAGNCQKAAGLFARFAPRRYVAVDIAVDFLRPSLAALQAQHPSLDMLGLGMDFSSGLTLPPEAGDAGQPRVLFYPGSSIGNFAPQAALAFLQSVHAACGHHPSSGLLIGVDLVKDAQQMAAAYDDALGVTAAFNLNLLRHINRLVGSDFQVRDWRHLAFFNAEQSRVEMHLEARAATVVRWPQGERRFAAGERIHTENACKWTLADFEALLRRAGFSHCQAWTDDQQRFAVVWAGL